MKGKPRIQFNLLEENNNPLFNQPSKVVYSLKMCVKELLPPLQSSILT